MQITVNGSAREVTAPLTVAELVRLLEFPDRGVAVAVDGAVVPKARWAQTMIAAHVDIEVLTAVQGG